MELEKTIPEFHMKGWGSEEWIVNNEKYCGKILNLNPGYTCSMHFHKNKDETFFIIQGYLKVEVINTNDGSVKELTLHTGEILRIPPLTPHRFTTTVTTVFIEFSTQHEESDSYRVIPGDSQKCRIKSAIKSPSVPKDEIIKVVKKCKQKH